MPRCCRPWLWAEMQRAFLTRSESSRSAVTRETACTALWPGCTLECVLLFQSGARWRTSNGLRIWPSKVDIYGSWKLMTSVCQRQTMNPSVTLGSQHLLVSQLVKAKLSSSKLKSGGERCQWQAHGSVPVPTWWGAAQSFNSSAGLSEVLV